jgi:large subunit ribosomal protein L4
MAEAKTPKVPVLGKTTKADVPADLFTEAFHQSLVHETARADANARRRGTASTLTRGEVSMTTAKAWRQKGTGRARAGALSVPHRYGGGVAFGPKPRHYGFKINRKARRRALRAALSVHAERGSVAVLDASSYGEPSTKAAADALAKWGADAPTLIVVGADEGSVAKSFRNIPRVQVAQAAAAGVADVIGAGSLVVTEAALSELASRTSERPSGQDASRSKSGEVSDAGRATGEAAAKPKAEAKPKAAAKAKAKPAAGEKPDAEEDGD